MDINVNKKFPRMNRTINRSVITTFVVFKELKNKITDKRFTYLI